VFSVTWELNSHIRGGVSDHFPKQHQLIGVCIRLCSGDVMSPARYELNSYILIIRNSAFKILSLILSGQSYWLQIQRTRVRFPVLPDFLRSRGSGTGSTAS
jgi:hypothetical protein